MAREQYEYRKTKLATGETKRWIGSPGEKSQPTSKEPFVMLSQAACADIARRDDLKAFDKIVFLHLLSILDEHNWIDVHHARIARQMSTEAHTVYRPNVTAAINRLITAGIIAKGEHRTYRLNPCKGWKGGTAAQAKAQKDYRAGRLSVVRPSPADPQ